MIYTVTMTVEAEDLSDAWHQAQVAFPADLSPASIKESEVEGLLSFSLVGGGKEIRFGTKTFASGGFIPGAGTMPVGIRTDGAIPRSSSAMSGSIA